MTRRPDPGVGREQAGGGRRFLRMRRSRISGTLVGGHLLGTFPSADLAARAAGAGDLRELGTHKPGGG